MTDTALAKRIRRHVSGRLRPYFIVTSPGFETLCFRELMSLPLTEKDARIVKGGIEFNGRLVDCWLANLCLKTATRVLMRIVEFSATNFRQLDRHLANIPWEIFLHSDSIPALHVTTKHSRLYHSDAVQDHIRNAISRRFHQQESPAADSHEPCKQEQKIFVRAMDDLFTLSVDSSGANLYKRGIKTLGGIAPIRETTAAAILELCGFSGQAPLIDPMCGTGTFSIEGAMIAQGIAAGTFRSFAFMNWPSFDLNRWNYLKRQYEPKPSGHPKIFASDTDPRAMEKLIHIISRHSFCRIITASRKDFFDINPSDLTDQKGLVVINPPYGIRIGAAVQSEHLFFHICRKLAKDFRGWKVALIGPLKCRPDQIPFEGELRPLLHGGIRRSLLLGQIP